MPEVKSTDHYLAPLKEDIEELLGRFQRTNSVRYERFSAVWREMDFASIHYGIPGRSEMRTFVRQALFTGYIYLVPPYNFQVRVGALYMLYGLYYTQLCWPREQIWVALKDWREIQEFIRDALRGQHYDVIYVYSKLLHGKAFCYAALPIPLTYEKKFPGQKKHVDELPTVQPEGVSTFLSSDSTISLRLIQESYEKMKASLSMTSSISATKRDIVRLIQDCAEDYEESRGSQGTRNMSKDCADPAEASESEMCSARAQLLASIKSKSYGHLAEASRSRRHRQVEGEVPSSEDMKDNKDGGEFALVYPSGRKRILSLKRRTHRTFGDEQDYKPTKDWLLAPCQDDKAALKRKTKNRFRW
ncbi:snRNA-activating protein complex subunit 1a isoform X2 [Engraulis encrasicolus]|uniref:snRNA-activating protein complex subunit 1a isoform X2 n=1 Tax=Engraulis encrasicolus TaxID=184585 RepID=UPI002FD0F7D5